MIKNDLSIRVSYADTDQMGMVYYANYFVYFERGRTELLRQCGMAYKDLEAKGIFFPVIESSCKYLAPARYDDELVVRTILSDIGSASIRFSYEVFCNDKIITTGTTRHPVVNRSFKPTRMPDEVKKMLNMSEKVKK